MNKWSFLKTYEFWVTTAIAIVLTFFGGYLFGSTTNNSISDSPSSINTLNQSGGTNNLNVNEESKYVWTNEKSWAASPTGQGTYQVNLTFVASGPVIPVSPCLYILSDSELISAGPIGSSSTWGTDTSDTGASIECFHGLANSVTFQVFFRSEPTKIGTQLVQDDRGLGAKVSQPSFILPVVQ